MTQLLVELDHLLPRAHERPEEGRLADLAVLVRLAREADRSGNVVDGDVLQEPQSRAVYTDTPCLRQYTPRHTKVSMKRWCFSKTINVQNQKNVLLQ